MNKIETVSVYLALGNLGTKEECLSCEHCAAGKCLLCARNKNVVPACNVAFDALVKLINEVQLKKRDKQ